MLGRAVVNPLPLRGLIPSFLEAFNGLLILPFIPVRTAPPLPKGKTRSELSNLKRAQETDFENIITPIFAKLRRGFCCNTAKNSKAKLRC